MFLPLFVPNRSDKKETFRYTADFLHEKNAITRGQNMNYHEQLKKRGIKKLKVVYSREKALRPLEDMSVSCRTNCVCPPGAARKCTERRDIPGSTSFVPSVAGLILAGEVVKDLIKEEFAAARTEQQNPSENEGESKT